MTNLETFTLTILVMENLLLFTGWWLWKHRHCLKCQQVKSLARVFSPWCANCQPQPEESEKPVMF